MIDAMNMVSGQAEVILFGESVLQGFDCLCWDYETDMHMAAALTDAPIQRMREAAKQCGRAKIPEVLAPLSYREMLKYTKDFEMTLFCYEAEEDSSVKNILKSRTRPATCAVIVGSEGGFSEDEVKGMIAKAMKEFAATLMAQADAE